MSERMSLEDFQKLRGQGIKTNFDKEKGKKKTSRKSVASKDPLSKKKTSKYKAKKVTINGIEFDSKIESQRYLFLMEQQRKQNISDLLLQETFQIVINGEVICSYKADFSYINKQGVRVVEDVKGMKTPVYRLKKKMMKACYGIDIQEIFSSNISSLL